jgi:hypothetical protein
VTINNGPMTPEEAEEAHAWAMEQLATGHALVDEFEDLLRVLNIEVPVAMFALSHCMGRVLAASSADEDHMASGVTLVQKKIKDITERYFKLRQQREMESKQGATQ